MKKKLTFRWPNIWSFHFRGIKKMFKRVCHIGLVGPLRDLTFNCLRFILRSLFEIPTFKRVLFIMKLSSNDHWPSLNFFDAFYQCWAPIYGDNHCVLFLRCHVYVYFDIMMDSHALHQDCKCMVIWSIKLAPNTIVENGYMKH